MSTQDKDRGKLKPASGNMEDAYSDLTSDAWPDNLGKSGPPQGQKQGASGWRPNAVMDDEDDDEDLEVLRGDL
ncbi:MAG: hypothetical protein ACLQVD_21615 [Capsulimonadaceae bacterium]